MITQVKHHSYTDKHLKIGLWTVGHLKNVGTEQIRYSLQDDTWIDYNIS